MTKFNRRAPEEVLEALADGWQVQRQATNSKNYQTRQTLQEEANFYFAYAASLLPDEAPRLKQDLIQALDAAGQKFIAGRERQLVIAGDA